MAAIRAVVFDLGHTLWDFVPQEHSRRLNALRLHQRLEEALGGSLPAPAALDRALDQTVNRWLAAWNGDRLEQPPTERLVSEALAPLGLTPPDDLLRELTAIAFGTEVDMPAIEPDTLAAVASLHQRGLVMGCVTNTILLEAAVLDVLARLGLRRYLRSAVVSSAMGYRKPHPSLFLRALDELDMTPQDAVFVGDRLIDDVGGAQAAGMRAVLTHQYRQEPLDGARATPDALVRRLGDLPRAIERMDGER